eukprot:gb/GECG01012660.1/.p1 GENE.gb/GECG01012660.1/~~gb/GECG01012660.1/.p1  ORF type:complete len:140 (+),score=7.16 gb/GECG01012660.1/:1-420(+)
MKCRELIQAHPLVMTRISYFCLYAAVSVYFPYLPIFYEERVTDNSQLVGTLLAFRPLLMLIAAPLWGGIADKLNRHRDVLVFLLAAASVFRFSMSFATNFPTAMILLIAAGKNITEANGAFFEQDVYTLNRVQNYLVDP